MDLSYLRVSILFLFIFLSVRLGILIREQDIGKEGEEDNNNAKGYSNIEAGRGLHIVRNIAKVRDGEHGLAYYVFVM